FDRRMSGPRNLYRLLREVHPGDGPVPLQAGGKPPRAAADLKYPERAGLVPSDPVEGALDVFKASDLVAVELVQPGPAPPFVVISALQLQVRRGPAVLPVYPLVSRACWN